MFNFQPSEASETKIQLPGLNDELSDNEEPPAKRVSRGSKLNLE